ncbi:MAG TPA: dephospho-CoA kinase [Gammaproteobacteria bacterium]|nr:dephospho-CoA kinase [Gammaproteobacteria bacterium]
MLRVGLTGGIASGKSLVGSMLEAYGAYLLDTDQVAREVVEPGQPALEALIETFGDSILAADGSLDRRRMRDLVFADADLRSRLEALLHPAIRARTLELMNAAAADSQPYTVVMVPLLVETSFAELVDRVLLVECPREIQLQRLMQRDAMTGEQAAAMIDAQADPAARRAAADDIIDNSGPIPWTRAQTWRLHLRYTRD